MSGFGGGCILAASLRRYPVIAVSEYVVIEAVVEVSGLALCQRVVVIATLAAIVTAVGRRAMVATVLLTLVTVGPLTAFALYVSLRFGYEYAVRELVFARLGVYLQ